jgi:SAM-dependent methyltransferase
MRSTFARTLEALVPARVYRALWSYMARRRANRWLRSRGVFELAVRVAEHFDYEVQSGPFKGMKYTRQAILSRHATPNLIGQYEQQIYPALMDAAGPAELIIDVGHAEGYYAVGLARLGKKVVAFDADPHERRVCHEMTRLNAIPSDRLSIRSWCSPNALRRLTRNKRALIFCDIEGGELELLTSATIADLSKCDLIVELHAAGPVENLEFVSRFLKTHQVEVINHSSEPRGAELLAFLGADAQRMAAEYRPPQQWMVARPKAACDRAG